MQHAAYMISSFRQRHPGVRVRSMLGGGVTLSIDRNDVVNSTVGRARTRAPHTCAHAYQTHTHTHTHITHKHTLEQAAVACAAATARDALALQAAALDAIPDDEVTSSFRFNRVWVWV